MLRHRTSLRATCLVAVTALVLAACGGDEADEPSAIDGPAATAGGADPTSGSATAGDGVAVGMALPGPQNDKGVSQAHYEGILLAEEQLGITANVHENITDPTARIDALRNLASENELVIGVGAEFAEAGVTVAPQFPDVEFMIINGQPDPSIPNLHVYGVRQGVPAFIAGVLAASLTDPDVSSIGFVGGLEIPPSMQSDAGFRAGAEGVDPGIEYATTMTGSFSDVAKAKDATAAQIASGVDAIFAMLDTGLEGAVQAAEDAGGETLLFDVIFPRCEAYPNIVGTAVLNSQSLVVAMVQDHLDGSIPTEPLFYGVEKPDIQRFQLCPGFDTPENQKIVDDTTLAIVNGEITVSDGS